MQVRRASACAYARAQQLGHKKGPGDEARFTSNTIVAHTDKYKGK